MERKLRRVRALTRRPEPSDEDDDIAYGLAGPSQVRTPPTGHAAQYVIRRRPPHGRVRLEATDAMEDVAHCLWVLRHLRATTTCCFDQHTT